MMDVSFNKYLLKNLVIFGLMVLTLACILFLYPKDKSRTRDLRNAIDTGVLFLTKIQRADGAICDTINPLFDIWETALAATAFYTVDKDSSKDAFSKAISFLKNNENTEGLICHNRKCRKAYCLETTSIYFQLLIDIGEKDKIKNQTSKIAEMQRSTGEWFIGNPDVSQNMDFPSVSAFAINLLDKSHTAIKYPNEAMSWLLGHQTDEGHWGQGWEYYDIPAYGLWQIMETLNNHATYPGVAMAKQNAIHYILSQQRYNGSWEYESKSTFRKPSNVLQTSLMLCALQKAGYSFKEKAVVKAVDFLLASIRKDGSWDGGFFPVQDRQYKKHEYVFATSLTLCCLSNHLDSLQHKQ